MNVSDYLIDQNDKDWSDLISDWMPLLPDGFTIWLVNRFGDLIIVLKNGSVHMIDVGAGIVECLADDQDQFVASLGEGDNADKILLCSLVDHAVASGMKLQPNQCYGYRVPPMLGGTYEVRNIEPTDLSVHYSLLAQIQTRTTKLPVGTRIERVTIINI